MLSSILRTRPARQRRQHLRLDASGSSAQGRERDANQDQWAVNPDRGVFLVADGVGGGACGDIASRTAAECLRQELSNPKDDYNSETDAADLIRCAFETAQDRILQSAASHDCECMGTTAACAVVRNGLLTVGWVGDSRIYLVRDCRARLMTHDHTIAQGLADAGVIDEHAQSCHRMRNVLWNYLGTGDDVPGTPDTRHIRLQAGDRILLVTDGVSDVLDESTLQSLATVCLAPNVAAGRIVQSAIAAGATDDTTCVAVFVEDGRR